MNSAQLTTSVKRNCSTVLDFRHHLGITNITTTFLSISIALPCERPSPCYLLIFIEFQSRKHSLTSIFAFFLSRLVLISLLILVSSMPSVGWLSHSVHKSSNFLLLLLIFKGSSQIICLLKSFGSVLFTLKFQTQPDSWQHSLRWNENWQK